MLALTFTRYHILASLQRIFNTQKNCHLLFSAVISEHFSKNRMIISAVAAKIWYLKNVQFLLGHPVVFVPLISATYESNGSNSSWCSNCNLLYVGMSETNLAKL